MHAATLAWIYSEDTELRSKLDAAVGGLIATQESDGYLGTYTADRRFGLYEDADWDVWSHKYCLIGLLAYHRATGSPEALTTARRAADLLLATFGDAPGQRSILAAGTHVGMAATSVLEPIVGLYQSTADRRYLEFARYIVRAWDEDGGPRVLSTLLDTGRVGDVGNGKAYEMLSNILGLVELARATGDSEALRAAERAWHDVAEHHLYATGTTSFGEHFHHHDELPDSRSVSMGETCVTVTWLQLTAALLAVTGEGQYAEEYERTVLNHLSAAQRPDGSGWCYYSPLDGEREYGSGVSCCISSGPRGMALAPTWVLASDQRHGALVVPWYQSASARLDLGGVPVRVDLTTGSPLRGGARLSFAMERPATFPVRLRVPRWADGFSAGGQVPDGAADGWLTIPARRYAPGESIEVFFGCRPRVVQGSGWNAGRLMLAWGPLVLAYRPRAEVPPAFDTLGDAEPNGDLFDGAPVVTAQVRNRLVEGGGFDAEFRPFATLGADGGRCRVWLAGSEPTLPLSAFHGARQAPATGELADYDDFSFASTERGEGEHAFELVADEPVTFSRVRFVHGRSLVHGGWFDSSIARPVIQVRSAEGAEWRTVARLAGYPATTASDDGGLRAGCSFDVEIPPATAVGLRVVGVGSYGEYPPGRFVTCAGIQAYA